MKRTFWFLFLGLWSFAFGDLFAQSNVSGMISSNTTWTLAGSPYNVTGGILVNSGVTLTIEAGVRIQVGSGIGIQIDGTISARGTSSNRITFTKSGTANWGYIVFSNSSIDATYDGSGNYAGGSILEYCIVEYAGGASISNNGAVRIDSSSYISNCEIRNNGNRGIEVFNDGSPVINSNLISNNISTDGGGGIRVLGNMAVTIKNNTIINNSTEKYIYSYQSAPTYGGGGGGILVRGSKTTPTIIDNNLIAGNNGFGGGGVYVMYAVIKNNIVKGNTSSGYSYDEGGGVGGYPILLQNNLIISNITDHKGGGAYVFMEHLRPITKNIIADNVINGIWSDGGQGGGLYASNVKDMTGNVIVNNSITDSYNMCCGGTGGCWGAGLYLYYSNQGALVNNIIARNKVNKVNGAGGIYVQYQGGGITGSNIFGNDEFDFYYTAASGSPNFTAENNWWGTSNEPDILALIFDWFDDANKAIVDYSPYSVTVRTDAPISPPSNVILSGNNVTWDANPESDKTGYNVYWDIDPGFPYSNVINAGNVTSYSITGLPAGAYVAITAFDDGYNVSNDDAATIVNENQTNGNESWFAAAAAAPPVTPVLSVPSNGAADQPLSFSLKWFPVTGATSYHLQVSTDGSFASIILYDVSQPDTVKEISGLASSTQYYWRVNASNASGTSSYSSAWSFTTQMPVASIGSVTGTSPLCISGSGTYTANSVVLSGGTGGWSSSNTGIATVNSSGLVTGVAAGSCNIIYTITGGYGGTVSAQQSVTINPDASIASVTGTSPLCIGSNATYLANSVVTGGGEGAWSSSSSGIASVNSSGLVSGVSGGNCNIIYTITGGCGGTVSAQKSVTVNPNASIASVTGTSPLCIGGATTFAAGTVVLSGGTGAWSSSNAGTATVNSSGLVTAVAAGNCNIIYTITGGCGGTVSKQQVLTVNPNASIASVTGTNMLCAGSNFTFSSNSVVLSGGAGAWNTSNIGVASVNASGLVTGVAVGSADIIYTITGGCGGTASAQIPVTIYAIPTITGTVPASRCGGGTIILGATPSTGTVNWYQTPTGGSSIATGTTYTTSVLSSTTTFYVDATANGCTSSPRSPVTGTVNILPPITIVVKWGDVLICPNLDSSIISYQWIKDNISITGADKQYYVTSGQPGVYMVETVDKNDCNNSSGEITIPGTKSLTLFPNPATSSFYISLDEEVSGKILITIINDSGIKIREYSAEKPGRDFIKEIESVDLNAGVYYIKVSVNKIPLYFSKIVIIK